MNARQIALLTQQLIKACGGLEEASDACGKIARNYSVQQLSRCQTPGSGCFLPADIIVALESYCGEPVMSRAFVEARPSASEARDLVKEACEASETVSDLQREIRLAASDGVITQAERDRLAKLHAVAEGQLRDVAAVINGDVA